MPDKVINSYVLAARVVPAAYRIDLLPSKFPNSHTSPKNMDRVIVSGKGAGMGLLTNRFLKAFSSCVSVLISIYWQNN